MMQPILTAELAARFSTIALGHIGREYPNASAHVSSGADDLRTPREQHPIFYGSFDWHSCVHGYWMLAYLLRRFPQIATATEIRSVFDDRFVPENVAGEYAYLMGPFARGFERPYGWAWLLQLAAELAAHDEERWSLALAPLAKLIAERFREFLSLPTYAVRSGTHSNTAFALRLAADYADAVGDEALRELSLNYARSRYANDVDCPAWGEPGGDDFLSPALVEAECMHRLLPAHEFAAWFERFLPRIAEREPAALFQPAGVADRSDGRIAHLDGLNLSRAWCWRALAAALPKGDVRAVPAAAAAQDHVEASLAYVASDYMGEHWLATYAVLALDSGGEA